VLADEVGRSLYEELDFRIEASNAAEFRRAHAYMPFIAGAHLPGHRVWQASCLLPGSGCLLPAVAACRLYLLCIRWLHRG
jgi:hypothetical protein